MEAKKGASMTKVIFSAGMFFLALTPLAKAQNYSELVANRSVFLTSDMKPGLVKINDEKSVGFYNTNYDESSATKQYAIESSAKANTKYKLKVSSSGSSTVIDEGQQMTQ